MSATGYVVIPGAGEGGTVSWGDVQNKPATFPPESHSHAYADVTGKPATFPPSAHSHAYADVTGKPSTFPPDAHSHAYADITGKPSTFAPSAHGHAIADTTGLQTALDEPARVFVDSGSGYVLSTTTDIYIGPTDPGTGLWVDTNA